METFNRYRSLILLLALMLSIGYVIKRSVDFYLSFVPPFKEGECFKINSSKLYNNVKVIKNNEDRTSDLIVELKVFESKTQIKVNVPFNEIRNEDTEKISCE